MKRRRGNPNWGKPIRPLRALVAVVTLFLSISALAQKDAVLVGAGDIASVMTCMERKPLPSSSKNRRPQLELLRLAATLLKWQIKRSQIG